MIDDVGSGPIRDAKLLSIGARFHPDLTGVDPGELKDYWADEKHARPLSKSRCVVDVGDAERDWITANPREVAGWDANRLAGRWVYASQWRLVVCISTVVSWLGG